MVGIETTGLLLTGQRYEFVCTTNAVENLLPSLILELLAPDGTPLARLLPPDSNTLQYTLLSLEESDGGLYTCRAVLVIAGSGIDSSTTATKHVTVVGRYCISYQKSHTLGAVSRNPVRYDAIDSMYARVTI